MRSCINMLLRILCFTQWSEFMALGSQSVEQELERRIKAQAPNKCCMLIYTVVFSRRRLIFMISSLCVYEMIADFAVYLLYALRNPAVGLSTNFLRLSHRFIRRRDLTSALFFLCWSACCETSKIVAPRSCHEAKYAFQECGSMNQISKLTSALGVA